MTDISESDRKLIDEMRQRAQNRLSPIVDTDYNILRFLQGNGYDIDQAYYWLQRHLKARKVYQNDEMDNLEYDDIFKFHFPRGLIGTTGKDNRLVMIETGGRTDIEGLMKSIQATEFFRMRMKFFEQLYKSLDEQERLTQKQSGVIYVIDCEGIKFDPFLLPTMTGPYRILCSTIMINYQEWISVILIVNVPTFFSVLWKAFGQFIPEHTRSKLKLLSGDKWKKELLTYIDADHLPVHWGGKMVDENGDPMCRSKIVVPPGKIPSSLYWKNVGKWKELPDNQLKTQSISAGTFKLISFFVEDANTVLHYYLQSQHDYTLCIYFADQDTKETDVSKMDEVFPQFETPGNLAPDIYYFVCEKSGVYHVKLGNEKAWFMSIKVKYQFKFLKPDGSPATVMPLNGDI